MRYRNPAVHFDYFIVRPRDDLHWPCPGRCTDCLGTGEIVTVEADGWDDDWPCGRCDGAGYMCGPCHCPPANSTCEHAPRGEVGTAADDKDDDR